MNLIIQHRKLNIIHQLQIFAHTYLHKQIQLNNYYENQHNILSKIEGQIIKYFTTLHLNETEIHEILRH